MTRIRYVIHLFFALTISIPICAQSNISKHYILAEQIESIAANTPPELAYIQTSKDIYEAGEDLWFKVYLLDAQSLIPSQLSKTLYLKLLEENSKKTVWEEKYEIINGFSDGRIALDGSMAEGDYLIAAFTPFSFYDDSSEFKAVRRIRIIKDITTQKANTVNSEKPAYQKSVPKSEKLIQFNVFPEGGDLISGIQSKMAFKAVNLSGEPADIAGTLYEDDIPVLNFAGKHAGMGSFNFTPDISKKYIIRVSEPLTDSTFTLPPIYSTGMTLKLVERDTESLIFKVEKSPQVKHDSVYLRMQCRGFVYSVIMADLSRDSLIELPLSGVPQGIAEVTLFNKSLVPVAERLVYINQYRKLNISTELLKESYSTRGKVTLRILVKDEDGWPVSANLGLTVFDKIYQNPLDSTNLLSYVFLSSQLKGRIYNPSFYFNSKSIIREEALDLLLLTQGWRRYIWNKTNLSVYEESKPEIIFDGTSGELYYPSKRRKIPREETFVMAFSPNLDSLNVIIPADSAGTFVVNPGLLSRWKDDYVYLKPFGSWGSKPKYKRTNPETPEYDLHIKLTDPFEIINNSLKTSQIGYSFNSVFSVTKEREVIPRVDGAIEIEGVTIKGLRENTLRGKYMRTLDSLVKYDLYHDYVCEFNVLNCPRHDRYQFGTTKPIPGNWYYQILAYGTASELVVRVPYFPPKFKEDDLLKMSNLTRVKAYSKEREFYSPNYDKKTGDEMIPDFRNTLLWEPSVITDAKGEATVSFFCSDINTVFVGRIEGVGGNGLLGAEYFSFSVRKVKLAPK